MSDARTAMLGRIRAAIGDVPAGEAEAYVAPPAAPAAAASVELFAERVADYRATVTRVAAASDVGAVVAEICARHHVVRLACAPGVDAGWLPSGVEALSDDPPLSVADLDAVDGVLTGAAIGVAETGTIVLDGAPLSGRRALTLVPDLHICVVDATTLVATVPAMVDATAAAIADGRPITLVSGPSATSDIEFNRVEGVHGPRRLEVVLVG